MLSPATGINPGRNRKATPMPTIPLFLKTSQPPTACLTPARSFPAPMVKLLKPVGTVTDIAPHIAGAKEVQKKLGHTFSVDRSPAGAE